MIDVIKDYVLSICITGLISGIIISLSPNSSIEKTIKLIASIFFVSVVITPFFSGKFQVSQNELEKYFSNNRSNSSGYNENFKKNAITTSEKALNEQILNTLIENGLDIKGVECEIKEVNSTYELKKVVLDLKKESKGNAINILKNKFNIKSEVIFLKSGE